MLLYLVPNLLGPPGGIARYCRLVCQALLAAGLPLHVIALLDTPAGTTQTASQLPGITYDACGGSRVAFLRRAAAASLRHRPDLLLIGHPNFAGMGRLLAAAGRATPVIFVYGIDVWQPLSPMRRWGLAGAAQVIAISQFTLGKAQQTNGVTAAQGRVLYNCLDPEFHQAATARPGPPRLLTVARMSLAEQYKGHDYVIRAMPALLARFPDLTYHIIGDGDARPGLAQLAAETGVSQAIHFHGFVSAAELQRHYEAATIYIMPSQAEGFGFVFLEAMSHGLPVIAGNQDATPEVVADGETGLLVDPTSVPAITTAAARLLADDGLRRQMGQAGRRRVQQQFSFDQFQQTLLTYLAELRPVRARA